jgi:hypothetical protein
VLADAGLPPDFEAWHAKPGASLNFIHRTVDGTELYFISNQREQPEHADCLFRVTGAQPQLWNPVSGSIHALNG